MVAFSPIGWVESIYLDPFGIPRQGGLHHQSSLLKFYPPFTHQDWFRELESFSHLWVLWLFQNNHPGPLSATVRPPRLGGNAKVGVFASRSPYRPNPIGLTAVEVVSIHRNGVTIEALEVLGLDCADQTPILDLKPYLPYADAIPGAVGGFASEPPPPVSITWAPGVLESLTQQGLPPKLIPVSVSPVADADSTTSQAAWADYVGQALAHDPIPAYHHDPERIYHVRLRGVEISFRRPQVGHLEIVAALPLNRC